MLDPFTIIVIIFCIYSLSFIACLSLWVYIFYYAQLPWTMYIAIECNSLRVLQLIEWSSAPLIGSDRTLAFVSINSYHVFKHMQSTTPPLCTSPKFLCVSTIKLSAYICIATMWHIYIDKVVVCLSKITLHYRLAL